MKFAGNYAIENGPILIELSTYRYHGHSMSDPGVTYRTKEEVQNVRKQRDPVEIARNMLLSQGWAQEKELKDYEKQVRKEVDEMVEKIKKDPFPEPKELLTDIGVTDGHYIRGVEYKDTIFDP